MSARVACLLFFASALVVYSATEQPRYNWDMIGYVASAYSYLGAQGQELSEQTYADVRAATDEARFEELTGGEHEYSHYRSIVYRDAAALQQQVPFYNIRVIYVLATIATSFFAGTMSAATYIVSLIAGAVTLLLLSSLLLRERLIAFLTFPFVLMVAGLGYLSRYSTPDMLASMVAIAIVCIGLQGGRASRLAMLLLPLLPAARTDYIILVPLFAWLLYSREYWAQAVIAVAASIMVYFAINTLAGNYGYLTIFNFFFISGPHPYPMEMDISANINDYIGAYASGIPKLLTGEGAAIIAAGTLLAIFQVNSRRSIHGFALAATAFCALHFMLFPAGLYRYYFVATGLSLVVIFLSASRYAPLAYNKVRKALHAKP